MCTPVVRYNGSPIEYYTYSELKTIICTSTINVGIRSVVLWKIITTPLHGYSDQNLLQHQRTYRVVAGGVLL
jgi:hypothetical protein